MAQKSAVSLLQSLKSWAHTGLLRRPAVTGAAAGGGGGGRSLRSLLGIRRRRRRRRRLGRALPSDATPRPRTHGPGGPGDLFGAQRGSEQCGEVWHLRRILSHSASPCKTCVICWGWEDIREKRTRKVKQNPGTRQLLAMRMLLETDTGRPSHSQPPRPQGNSYRGKPDATCCQHLPGVAETLR